MFDPDLLVAWMTEAASGGLDRLLKDVAWACGGDKKTARTWVAALQPLGVADIDWRNRSWAARPLVLGGLPGAGNTALLVGARPAGVAHYRRQGAVVVEHAAQPGQLSPPPTVWIQYEDSALLEAAAAAVGATIVPCLARSLAAALPRFRLGPECAPPASDSEVSRLDPSTGTFVPCEPPRSQPRGGMYKYSRYGRVHRYAICERGRWYEVDRREGIRHVLPARSLTPRWAPERPTRSPKGTVLGQLSVDIRAPLPLRHEEAAVMCTGLPPIKEDGRLRYDGVPLDIARRIAQSLRCNLETA